MKRTTLFVDEQLERELQALARHQGRPMAAVVREAVEQYVVTARAASGRSTRAFVALGRSGRRNTAERHEDLLFRNAADERADGGVSGRAARGAARGGKPMRRRRA